MTSYDVWLIRQNRLLNVGAANMLSVGKYILLKWLLLLLLVLLLLLLLMGLETLSHQNNILNCRKIVLFCCSDELALPYTKVHLRIEMQSFSLHWMMQNIRLFNVCEARRASRRH